MGQKSSTGLAATLGSARSPLVLRWAFNVFFLPFFIISIGARRLHNAVSFTVHQHESGVRAHRPPPVRGLGPPVTTARGTELARLCSAFSLVICLTLLPVCTRVNPNLIHPTPPWHPTFVLYTCVSISALHRGSSRPFFLANKGPSSRGYVLPVVMCGCESWTLKKAERRRIDVFGLWCWRRLLRVPWSARRSNQSILKEISPGCSLEGLMLKLKLQYFGYLMQRVDSLKKTLMLGGIGGRRRRG